MTIDHLSLSTTPIILRNNDDIVSQGTGFLFLRELEGGQVLFLVTNYHVLTGSSPEKKEPPKGNNIEWFFHTDNDDSSKVKPIRWPLFTKEGTPIWLTSSSCPEADLAVIPIPHVLAQDCDIRCISEQWHTESDLLVRPTTPGTLVGYPYGFYDKTNSLPVWKTGSIASEPEVDFEGKPYFLLDISAFPGMSGSPAFAISYGTYESTSGAAKVGGVRKFLGIYASMQMLNKQMYLEQLVHADPKLGVKDQESLELGHVWKASLIIDLINNLDIEKYDQDILAKIQ
ncbi:MAG: S1 family peptidase [Pseudomonadota bacterium]